MGDIPKAALVHEFLGSGQIFVAALVDVLDSNTVHEVLKDRITVTQLKLLKLVSSGEPHNISEVATFLGVSNAAASKMVDKLVRQLLLRRSEGEADRRTMLLTLTERSRRMISAYDEARNLKLSELFGDVAAADLRRTIGLLDRLSARIVEHHSRPEDVCLQCGIYSREKCVLDTILERNCVYHRFRKAKDQPGNAVRRSPR